jgi:hypothetical protein
VFITLVLETFELVQEETVVPQNIDFKIVESENIDENLIELLLLSNTKKVEYLKDQMAKR